jgi:hypothetical protein
MPTIEGGEVNDYRSRISSHAQFDDSRYWRFTRNSGLPHGTFGKRRRADSIVFATCMVLLALGLLAANLTP